MTFTKLFASITESTIWQEDDHTRLVWITMLAMCNKHGFVFGSEPGLSRRANVPLDSTIRALEKFQQPDKYSRTKEHEGRRIEVIDGGWRLLNYEKHRAIRNEEERREYMKLLMRDIRAKRKQDALAKISNVSRSKPPLAQAEAEAEAECREQKRSSTMRTFVRPSLEEIKLYCKARNNQVDPQKFVDYYESNGWKVGRNPMKNWKAAVGTWEKNGFTNGGNSDNHKTAAQLRIERTKASIARSISETHDSTDQPSSLFKGTGR